MGVGTTQEGSVGNALLSMVGLSMLLFWIQTVGPALVAAIIPAVLVGALIFLLGAPVSLPVIDALVGAGLFFVILFQSVPLLTGALIGGALAG